MFYQFFSHTSAFMLLLDRQERDVAASLLQDLIRSFTNMDIADPVAGLFDRQEGRSEEHTSELQSLMRISYAVFCLKKKNRNSSRHTHHLEHYLLQRYIKTTRQQTHN